MNFHSSVEALYFETFVRVPMSIPHFIKQRMNYGVLLCDLFEGARLESLVFKQMGFCMTFISPWFYNLAPSYALVTHSYIIGHDVSISVENIMTAFCVPIDDELIWPQTDKEQEFDWSKVNLELPSHPELLTHDQDVHKMQRDAYLTQFVLRHYVLPKVGDKLSKLPVKSFFHKGFENSKGREFCMAKLDVGSSNSLFVANSHLKSPDPPEMYSTKRVAQAKEALSYLSNIPNVVFGGDMNWCEMNDGPFPLHGAWMDAWTKCRPEENGWTYDTRANQSLRGYRSVQERLDRFICKLRDFEIIGISMIGMEAISGISYLHKNMVNPVYPSDHFGLLLTLSTI